MRVMIFVDLENFKGSLWGIDKKRQPKYDNFHFFLVDSIAKIFGWEKHNPRLVRCYMYTGEYTESLIQTIKKAKDNCCDVGQQQILTDIYDKNVKRKTSQESLFEYLIGNPFMEIKTTPLKFEIKKGVFQKGVDVLLAVDLLSHAFRDNFDVGIVCSGDLDLLESIKLSKDLGKKIIIVSNGFTVSKNIVKAGDYFYDVSKIPLNELDQISEIVIKKPKGISV